MTSPAETLSRTKRRQRPKRNPPAASEFAVWECRLEVERCNLNLSMRDVADAVGLSLSAYFRVEKGYADVSLSNAIAIARFFGMSIPVLWIKWQPKGTP